MYNLYCHISAAVQSWWCFVPVSILAASWTVLKKTKKQSQGS